MFGWEITEDMINEEDNEVDTGEYHGESDPKNVIPFRLLDGDDEVYFTGIISRRWLEGLPEFAFALLDTLAPNYGLTTMKYRYPNEEGWREL